MTENVFFDSQRPNDYVGVWRMLGERISAGDSMESTQLVQDYLNIIQLLSKSLKPC